MSQSLKLVPITKKSANRFIKQHHAHHGPVVGWKFAVGLDQNGELVGVAIAGRPVSRETQRKEPQTCEVTRVCTVRHPNAASMLWGAISRAAFALGYTKAISKVLCTESGHSLKCAGWKCKVDGEGKPIVSRGGSWSRPSRKRIDKHPLEPKHEYFIEAHS